MYIRLNRRESRKEGRKKRIEGGREEKRREGLTRGQGGRREEFQRRKRVVKFLQIIMRCCNNVKTISGTKEL